MTYFRSLEQKSKNNFVGSLVQMKPRKFAFEINWPLVMFNNTATLGKMWLELLLRPDILVQPRTIQRCHRRVSSSLLLYGIKLINQFLFLTALPDYFSIWKSKIKHCANGFKWFPHILFLNEYHSFVVLLSRLTQCPVFLLPISTWDRWYQFNFLGNQLH